MTALRIAWIVAITIAFTGCASRCASRAFPNATFSNYSCCGVERYVWNGEACVALHPTLCGCLCKGADCDQIYGTYAACMNAHRGCEPKS